MPELIVEWIVPVPKSVDTELKKELTDYKRLTFRDPGAGQWLYELIIQPGLEQYRKAKLLQETARRRVLMPDEIKAIDKIQGEL